MGNSVNAWAVRSGGTILPETVHRHRRGAIVNWLVAHAGVLVMAGATDEQIEQKWLECSNDRRRSMSIEAIEVEIREVWGADV